MQYSYLHYNLKGIHNSERKRTVVSTMSAWYRDSAVCVSWLQTWGGPWWGYGTPAGVLSIRTAYRLGVMVEEGPVTYELIIIPQAGATLVTRGINPTKRPRTPCVRKMSCTTCFVVLTATSLVVFVHLHTIVRVWDCPSSTCMCVLTTSAGNVSVAATVPDIPPARKESFTSRGLLFAPFGVCINTMASLLAGVHKHVYIHTQQACWWAVMITKRQQQCSSYLQHSISI